MKGVKIIAALTAACILLLSLSGCSLRFSAFDELLRPPKLSGEYQGLQDSFEKAVGEDFTLSTPENGDYQSAFVTFDIDSDGDEEAVVFYTSKSKPDAVSFWYFEHDNGEWKPVSSNDGLGNSVDRVIFSDLNLDGTFEIIIGWNLFSGKTNKVFSSYAIDREKVIAMNSYPYTYLSATDINGDGVENIFTLTVDSTVPEHLAGYARVYNFNSQKFTLNVLSEARTDGNVSSYASVNTETVGDTKYIYVEALKGEHDSVTELLYWDNETSSLVSPLFDTETQTTKFSWRNTVISCFDVDGDKFLEIPTSVEMKGSSNLKDVESNEVNDLFSESLYFTKWIKYRNGRMTPVQYSVINDTFGYMLNIQSSWVGRVTVVSVDGQWSFYRWISGVNEIGDLLFSIEAYPKNSTEIDVSEYKPLGSSSNTNYYYKITDAGTNFGVTDKNIEDRFILTDFGGTK